MHQVSSLSMLAKYKDFSINIRDGVLYYIPEWLNCARAQSLYERLYEDLIWQQDSIKVFGRWHKIPRLQSWYGDSGASYRYSGRTFKPLAWHPVLEGLRDELAEAGIEANAVLANLYRDGCDKMGWHSDNEPELGVQPTIASLSLGRARTFQLKHKRTGERRDLELEAGSLLIMAGDMQSHWVHALPQRKRVSEGRINLTFRMVSPQRK